MTKVYLSSTLLDLRDERQAVTNWLIAAGFQPVHSYVADSETVRDSCLDDVNGCALYVLILGHRYGFQPTQRNQKKRSITELEYRKARQLKVPCLAFLRTSVPDVALSDINDTARYASVQAFRAEVGRAQRPAEFRDMSEFLHALGTAMTRHVMKLLEQRDAQSPAYEQRIAELESALTAARESAVVRILAEAADPADNPAQVARQALLQGDTVRAEQLLRTQEDRAAQDAAAQRREAAELAREIAALATGRSSAAALAALERVVTYLPDDYRAHGELGDALVVDGRTDSALDHYQTALRLGLELAARDPANTQWQRDLIVSHVKIAEAGGGSAPLAHALNIAETMQAKGILAPRDVWLIDDLKRRLAP